MAQGDAHHAARGQTSTRLLLFPFCLVAARAKIVQGLAIYPWSELASSASPIGCTAAGESGTVCSASLFFMRTAGIIQWGGAVEVGTHHARDFAGALGCQENELQRTADTGRGRPRAERLSPQPLWYSYGTPTPVFSASVLIFSTGRP
jgi:hypothetical protein